MCLTPRGRTGSSGGSASASRSGEWTRGSPSYWSPGRCLTWAAPMAGSTRIPGPAALPTPTTSGHGETIRARRSPARGSTICAATPSIRPITRSWPNLSRSRRWSARLWTGDRPCVCWATPRRSRWPRPISPAGYWSPAQILSSTVPGAAICGPCPRIRRTRTPEPRPISSWTSTTPTRTPRSMTWAPTPSASGCSPCWTSSPQPATTRAVSPAMRRNCTPNGCWRTPQ